MIIAKYFNLIFCTLKERTEHRAQFVFTPYHGWKICKEFLLYYIYYNIYNIIVLTDKVSMGHFKTVLCALCALAYFKYLFPA